ncbi:MAG TPA: TPM domain-containing protein [Desulfobulbus sp.]|nr:TPM domain-containing protein [Desulfobulbus sp.]
MRWRPELVLLLVLVLLPILPARAASPPVPRQPPGRVVDLAGVIDTRTEDRLAGLLQDLEQKTSVQMVILTVDSLDGEDINSFSLRVAEQWKLGQKGKDNGLLLSVAVRDRKYRFEVGYGLEEVLPDSLVGTIGRRALVPWFRKGEYGRGILVATGEVIRVLAKHYGVTITGLPQQRMRRSRNNSTDSLVFFLIFLGVVVVGAMRRGRRSVGGIGGRRGPGMIFFPGGGWGGGGGFSGGGFGGFSGGGGGFGGGGASGGW